MKIIIASTLGIAFLFAISFLFLKPSEASVGSYSEITQPTPPANQKTIEAPTPSPTPATVDTPATLNLTVEKDPGFTKAELSLSQIFDISVGSTDFDCDGIPNRDDNCPLAYNPNQRDKHKNAIGDVCEGKAAKKVDRRCDTDKDGVLDRNDNCILVCNPDQTDKNRNGIGDVCDPALLKDWVHINPCTEQQHKKRSSKTRKP